jgi:hypothetical protein
MKKYLWIPLNGIELKGCSSEAAGSITTTTITNLFLKDFSRSFPMINF